MAGTFTITGLSATEPAGSRQFGPITIQGTVVIGETYEALLASGENTFPIPPQSTACLIIPPLNGSVELKLKTNLNSADGGLLLSQSNPTLYSLQGSPVSLIIATTVSSANPITLAFI